MIEFRLSFLFSKACVIPNQETRIRCSGGLATLPLRAPNPELRRRVRPLLPRQAVFTAGNSIQTLPFSLYIGILLVKHAWNPQPALVPRGSAALRGMPENKRASRQGAKLAK